ncbi:MAG: glycosyltransferase family 2 protein [Ignavibacteriae bacterium]|nr:glycosyltransferase family 2 protein [Ignavibacteriota bacterium]
MRNGRPSNEREPREERHREERQEERIQDERQQHGGQTELSVIIPLLNEEQSLRELYNKLRDALSRGGYEIIFVDDGSTDGSLRVLHELRNRDRRVKIIRFRRNFGKSAALAAGFKHAKGDYVVTMDSDLQDDPAEIPNLINELKKGFDLVSGWKRKRKDPISKTIPSKFFNFVTSLMTNIKLHDFNCGLKAYRKEVVKSVKVYGELHRYIPVLAHWQGFKVGEIQVKHSPRKYGKTKFGMGRFWKGFLDLLTVLFTTRYIQRPLHLFGFWGSVSSLAGFLTCLYLVFEWFAGRTALSNRPLFLAGVMMIIVGVQFISLGLLGEMIAKTRLEGDDEYSISEFWK